MTFLLMLFFWTLVTGWLWWSADRCARPLRPWPRRATRPLFAAFFVSMVLYPGVPLLRMAVGNEPAFPPVAWATAAYIWFPIVLNLTIATVVVRFAWRGVRRLAGGRRNATAPSGDRPAQPQTGSSPTRPPATPSIALTRRQALGLAAAALPPFATIGLTAAALAQRGRFRVRRVELPVPGLPADLDGLTIAHLTDVHAGHFVPPDAVARLADVVNAMATDLVAFTGDLIDRGLLDRLPLGLTLVDRLDRRDRLAMIEGNHDVFEDAAKFEQVMRDLRLPLLLDEQATFVIPGRRTPVQLLGLAWGELKSEADVRAAGDPDRMLRVHSEAATAAAVRTVAALRQPGAFPILLAHHPHAADPAAAAGLPLVLAGHTHGGQVMLNDDIGAGPLRFRYWNGVHRLAGTTLTICNGIGSWFPLRVNAPAEVVHLTLRHAVGAS